MSTSRQGSRLRRMRRVGYQKIDFETGRIIKRPFPNKANPKRKKTHRFVSPIIVVDRNGKDVAIPATTTVAFKRRVFENEYGHYPEGAATVLMVDSTGQHCVGRDPETREKIYEDRSKIREVMAITDTKEVAKPTYRVKLTNRK